MAKYNKKTITNKKYGKSYTYYYWSYTDNLGKQKFEQDKTVEGLDKKVARRKRMLSAGINAPITLLSDYVENYLRTVQADWSH